MSIEELKDLKVKPRFQSELMVMVIIIYVIDLISWSVTIIHKGRPAKIRIFRPPPPPCVRFKQKNSIENNNKCPEFLYFPRPLPRVSRTSFQEIKRSDQSHGSIEWSLKIIEVIEVIEDIDHFRQKGFSLMVCTQAWSVPQQYASCIFGHLCRFWQHCKLGKFSGLRQEVKSDNATFDDLFFLGQSSYEPLKIMNSFG